MEYKRIAFFDVSRLSFLIRVDWGDKTVVWDMAVDQPYEYADIEWPVERKNFSIVHPGTQDEVDFESWWHNYPYGWQVQVEDGEALGLYRSENGHRFSNSSFPSMLASETIQGEEVIEPNTSIDLEDIDETVYFNVQDDSTSSGDTDPQFSHTVIFSEQYRVSTPLWTTASRYFRLSLGEKESWSYAKFMRNIDQDIYIRRHRVEGAWVYGEATGHYIVQDENFYNIPLLDMNKIEYEVRSFRNKHIQIPYIDSGGRFWSYDSTREFTGPELQRPTIGGGGNAFQHPWQVSGNFQDYPMCISIISDDENKKARQGCFVILGLPWKKPYEEAGTTRSEERPADFFCFFREFSHEDDDPYVSVVNGKDSEGNDNIVMVPEDLNPFDLTAFERLTNLEAYLRDTIGTEDQEGTLTHGENSWTGALNAAIVDIKPEEGP